MSDAKQSACQEVPGNQRNEFKLHTSQQAFGSAFEIDQGMHVVADTCWVAIAFDLLQTITSTIRRRYPSIEFYIALFTLPDTRGLHLGLEKNITLLVKTNGHIMTTSRVVVNFPQLTSPYAGWGGDKMANNLKTDPNDS